MTDDSRRRAAQVLAESRSAMPMQEAQRLIHERRNKLLGESAKQRAENLPELDVSPAPLPNIVDDPFAFGADFARRRAKALPDPPKPKRRPGRKPKQIEAKPELARFRVIDGGGDNPNNA